MALFLPIVAWNLVSWTIDIRNDKLPANSLEKRFINAFSNIFSGLFQNFIIHLVQARSLQTLSCGSVSVEAVWVTFELCEPRNCDILKC